MKVFCDKSIKIFAVAMILSLLAGLATPFFAFEIPEIDEPVKPSDDSVNDTAPYVIFDARSMEEGGMISNQCQGTYTFGESSADGVYRLHFTPDFKGVANDKHDPSVRFTPSESYSADEYKYVTILTRANMEDRTSYFELFFVSGRSGNFSGEDMVAKQHAKTNDWQFLCFDLTDDPGWIGETKMLRLDFYSAATKENLEVEIAAIIFSKTPADVYDAAYKIMCEDLFPAKQSISDFTEADLPAFSTPNSTTKPSRTHLNDTAVSVRDGCIRFDVTDELHDPYVGFFYKEIAATRGMEVLTTANFESTVVKYRTSPKVGTAIMEYFLFTGSQYGPYKINKTTGDVTKEVLASISKAYVVPDNNGWKCVAHQLNYDFLKEEAWKGDFNGFRIDWCSNPVDGAFMEIAEMFFYEDAVVAQTVSNALNTIKLPLPQSVDPNKPLVTYPSNTSAFSYADAGLIEGIVSEVSNAECNAKTVDGEKVLSLKTTTDDSSAFVELNAGGINSSKYKYVSVLLKTGEVKPEKFTLYYKSEGEEYSADRAVSASYASIDSWQVLTFKLSDSTAARSASVIDGFRLNFAEGAEASDSAPCEVEIKAISLSENYDAVFDGAYYMLSKIYVPVQVLSDFTTKHATYFGSDSTGNYTTVRADLGNLIYTATATGKDPSKQFDYAGYVKNKGIRALTTQDFQYTVIRYRGVGIDPGHARMELYYITGNANGLEDMIRSGSSTCHSGSVRYEVSSSWSSMVINMAETDGLEENTALKYGWNREDGNYTFKGFRVDWCNVAVKDSYMEISDFLFYKNESDARAMSAALKELEVEMPSMNLPDLGGGEDLPDEDEDEDEFETEDDTLTEESTELESESDTEVLESTETEPESDTKVDESEETLPPSEDFTDESEDVESESDTKVDESEETLPPSEDFTDESEDVESESDTEYEDNTESEPEGDTESEESSETEPEDDTETEENTESDPEIDTEPEDNIESDTENDTKIEFEPDTEGEPDSGGVNNDESQSGNSSSGGNPSGGGVGQIVESETGEGEGSQAPTTIAYATLATLSFASVIAVVVIKFKKPI